MSKKLEPEERERRKKERDRAYYLKHYDAKKQRYRSHTETWRKENREASRAISRRAHAKLRQTVLSAYGGKCACCGIDDWRFLTIDHINNDGAEARRADKRFTGPNIYGWLKANGYPSGFQVLCYNCNIAKSNYGGVCPHQISPNSFNLETT